MKKIFNLIFTFALFSILFLHFGSSVMDWTGLQTYYTFDGNANNSVWTPDGRNNCTVTGAVNTSGIIGSAYNYSGSSQYMSCGQINNVNLTIALSTCAWVSLTNYNPNPNNIMWGKITDGSSQRAWVMESTNANGFGFVTSNDGSWPGTSGEVLSGTGKSLNTWYFVCGVYDNSTQNISIWVNGVNEGNKTWAKGIKNSTAPLTFGYYTDGGVPYFKGKLDEASVFNRSLSASEIITLYNAGVALQYNSSSGADTTYPQFSNSLQNVTNNTAYVFGKSYNFSVNILNTNGTAGVTFNSVNYTLTNTSNNFNYTFGGLSAGTYNFSYWAYGNGSSHLFNSTSNYSYIVALGNSTLGMNLSTTTPITYGTNSSFSGAETNNGDGSCSYVLNDSNQIFGVGTIWMNYSTTGCANYSSGWVINSTTINQATPTLTFLANGGTANLTLNYTQLLNISATTNAGTVSVDINSSNYTANNQNVTLGASYYLFRANVTGNANYTDLNYSWLSVTINPISPTATLLLNGTAGNITMLYPNQINASFTNNTIAVLQINGTNITNKNNIYQNLGVGYWNFTLFSLSNQNYTSASLTRFGTITQATSTLNLSLNGNQANLTANTPANINLNCSTLTGDTGAILTMYNNGTLISNKTSPLGNLTAFSILGRYNISCYYASTQNYTTSNKTWWITVYKNTSTDTFSANLSDGTYLWTFQSCAIDGACNQSANRTITIDTIKPVINISYPVNGSTYNHEVTINYSASDLHLSSCWWNNGGANNSISCSSNITGQTWSEGTNTVNIYANDTAGNVNKTSVLFYVNTSFYYVQVNSGFLSFQNCSPDFENSVSIPYGQNVISAIGMNLSEYLNVSVRINQTAATGWTLYASNQSNLSNKVTLNTTYKNILNNVTGNKSIWLVANCSFINSNPRTFINVGIN